MDRAKYFDVTHREHVICNPISSAGVDAFVASLGLGLGSRVLDVACGRGEVLVRIAERYEVSGVGIDISPLFVLQAERRAVERAPGLGIEFVCGDGMAFRDGRRFDLAMCLGASWVFGGFRRTLLALRTFVGPGGLVACGEGYKLRPAEAEYFPDAGPAAFASHAGNLAIAAAEGFEAVAEFHATEADYAAYIDLQQRGVERYARANGHDPDVLELRRGIAETKDRFERLERGNLGWAIYLFRA